MSTTAVEVGPGVHRLGSALVNLYLLEEAGQFTVVDAGLPGHFEQVRAAVEARGGDLHDVEAVVLTHAHADSIGCAERLRTEAQAKVHVHGADAQMARTAQWHQAAGGGRIAVSLWRPATLRYLAHAAAARRTPRVEDLTTFADGATLDVPGSPAVVGTPGHSHGHCALLLADRDLLLAGDALCSRDPLTGRLGPQLMPRALNADTEQALASLDRLATTGARALLFARGEPWTAGAQAAVDRARHAAGATSLSH